MNYTAIEDPPESGSANGQSAAAQTSEASFLHLGRVRDPSLFEEYLREHKLPIPFDRDLVSGAASPLATPIKLDARTIGNRICVQPMEGWDGTTDGRPTERTEHRWRLFGRSGAKLIWGGEAVAVLHKGRANPNQLLINESTSEGLRLLRDILIEEHIQATGSADDMLIGLQLTYSGRYSRPNAHDKPEPRILYHHPLLDRRVGVKSDDPLLTDGEIREIIEAFHRAARISQELGYDFIDIKHCHGYLGHEFLSAYTREGDYGGSFENRTRFLREIVEGVRAVAPGLEIGVRLSAFDAIPYKPDPSRSVGGKLGPGIPEPFEDLIPYRWAFGVNPQNPVESDLTESVKFLSLLRELGIRLVNISAGSPYYNPHIQRPALYPPSDGYQPPEDPLVGVARQLDATRALKEQFPDLIIVGTGYTYLQDFLPNVAQPAIRDGWADSIGLGRMILTYPEMLLDVLQGKPLQHKRVCRTFSDCTTAPRNGLPSGCYPLDTYYKNSHEAVLLKEIKGRLRKAESQNGTETS
jgi:NADPH2 dehydrogenase